MTKEKKPTREDFISRLEDCIKKTGKSAKLLRELWKDHLKKVPDDKSFSEQLFHRMRCYELDIKMAQDMLKYEFKEEIKK